MEKKTMNESRKKTALLNKKGYGLLEILVASVIGSALLVGGAQFLQITLQAHNISQSLLIESNLRQKIATSLSNDCALKSTDTNKLLRPSRNGLDSDLKGEFIGTLPGDIKKGDFKSQIDIVKIELKDPTSDPPDDSRVFSVYYKKKNLGADLNAPDSANCTTSPVNTAGCYEHTCQVKIDSTTKICREFVSCDAGTVVLRDRECGQDEVMKGIKANGELICHDDCPNTGRVRVRVTENGQDVYKCECPYDPMNPFLTVQKKWIQSAYSCGTCPGTWIKRTDDRTLPDGTIIRAGENDCRCSSTGQTAWIHKAGNRFVCCNANSKLLLSGRCCPTDRIVGDNEACCQNNYVQAIYDPSWYSDNTVFFKKFHKCCPKNSSKYHPGLNESNSVTVLPNVWGNTHKACRIERDNRPRCCNRLSRISSLSWVENANSYTLPHRVNSTCTLGTSFGPFKGKVVLFCQGPHTATLRDPQY